MVIEYKQGDILEPTIEVPNAMQTNGVWHLQNLLMAQKRLKTNKHTTS
jgi:hypothetical protein